MNQQDANELAVPCRICGAREGAPCVALGRSRYRDKGDPINGYHVVRTMLLREQQPSEENP